MIFVDKYVDVGTFRKLQIWYPKPGLGMLIFIGLIIHNANDQQNHLKEVHEIWW